MKPSLGVGMVGYSFMGAVHSHAWRTVQHVFDVPVEPAMVAICGRDESATTHAATKLGWQSVETDWRALIARPDIQIVDICAPGSSHAEIAIAALAAGKHVFCEKPLATTVDEAEHMAAAAATAQAAGVLSMVGFNYRRVPALAQARQMIADGRLGVIREVRAAYLQDWIADPDFPLVWRLKKEEAGAGALGDIGSHIIDAAQFLLDSSIVGVSGLLETFIKERPLGRMTEGLRAQSTDGTQEMGLVTVDDAALFTSRFANGAIGSFEASRFAVGRKNAMSIQVYGSKGSMEFNFESMNELLFHDHTIDPLEAGFRRILVTEADHPYLEGWWPPGHVIGYEHTFTNELKDFLDCLATGTPPTPSFADGLQVQRVLDAVETSSASKSTWVDVKE
jgi:predicted dehydrogenase